MLLKISNHILFLFIYFLFFPFFSRVFHSNTQYGHESVIYVIACRFVIHRHSIRANEKLFSMIFLFFFYGAFAYYVHSACCTLIMCVCAVCCVWSRVRSLVRKNACTSHMHVYTHIYLCCTVLYSYIRGWFTFALWLSALLYRRLRTLICYAHIHASIDCLDYWSRIPVLLLFNFLRRSCEIPLMQSEKINDFDALHSQLGAYVRRSEWWRHTH